MLKKPLWQQSLLITTGLITLLAYPLTFDGISLSWFWGFIALVITWHLAYTTSLRFTLKTLWVSNLLWTMAWIAFQFAVKVRPDISWHDQGAYQQVLDFSPLRLLPGWILLAGISTFYFLQKRTHQKLVRKPRLLPWLGLGFILSLLVANITTQKISHFWGITVDVGTWFFPLTYIFNDLFTEVYGYNETRKYIWAAIAANLFMVASFYLLVAIGHSSLLASFHTILYTVPRILVASLISFFCGEFFNAYALAKLKVKMQGKWLALRTIGSTGIGVAIDSVIFVSIAFIGALPLKILATIALWEYVLKVGYEILATPLTCWLISRLKQYEKSDVYDHNTRFSPFQF